MTFATLLSLAATAAMPAVTAFRYAQFALSPASYGEEYASALAVLMIAQIPLCLLAGAFAAVSYIEGPAWHRVAAYVVVVGIVGVAGGFAGLAWDTELGPIIGWAIAMQLFIIVVAGPLPDLARARISAVAEDSVNLLVLTPFIALPLGIVAVALQPQIARLVEWRSFSFEWSDLAWMGAAYFALRTWSAVYVFTRAFEARRKGFFQRKWIERLVTPNPKGDSS